MIKVLITGAAGNLGSLLANHIKKDVLLNLMYHKKPIDEILATDKNVRIFQCDLSDKESLTASVRNVDVIVHFAGVLFKGRPEKFLPKTNTKFFANLVDVAERENVKRIILISFPHVEGETFPDKPAVGRLDAIPDSVHAATRLEEEKLLFNSENSPIETVSLRVGMVYGKGILMIDAAKWFARHHLLGIWKKPTWIHLISTFDFLESTRQAILKKNIRGIYHLGDEGKQTLQEFLDAATKHWGFSRPVRMNINIILLVASLFEIFSVIFKTRSILTRDFIKIGSVSYYGDTTRMRNELLKELKHITFNDGIETL